MIYYVAGNFGARKGISVGAITLHPSVFRMGRSRSRREGARVTETTELAVMCEHFGPLRLSALARDLDDGSTRCLVRAPAEDQSLAGVTSHL